ncbi:MAG: PAS domain-containing protein, partial [Halobacterium sp.]
MSPVPAHLADTDSSREWLVGALGAGLTLAALGHFHTHGRSEPLVVAATVLPAVAVLAYGVWFWLSDQVAARGDAVFAWAVGGAGLVLAFDLWATTVNAYGAGANTSHVFIQHTSIGALGAALAGTYSEHGRHQARAHDRLRRALDAAMDGVAVLDADGCIAYANGAFCEDYGADDPSAVVGTHWTEYYPGDAESQLAAVFDSFADGSSDYWHGKVVARRVDGRTYPQELSITPLPDGCVWVSRDVTDREERDQRLRVLNRVLRHNVRNSLNVVLGHANRLDEEVEDSDDAERIVDAAEELLAVSEKARVVERVLDSDDLTTATLGDLVTEEVERARSNYPDV